MEEFLKSKITLYRVGTTQEGYSSFFLNKEQAISYAKRMDVDMIFSYVTEGENIIPTMSGANEVVVEAGLVERLAEIPY